MQMVGVDDNGLASGGREPPDQDVEQRLAGHREEGFGHRLGIRQQTGSQPRREDQRFHGRSRSRYRRILFM